MNRQAFFVLVGTMVLIAGSVGVGVASPGDGTPSDTPSVVPEFVTNLLGTIGDFVGGILDLVFGVVEQVTPEAAEHGIDTARSGSGG